MNLLRKNLGNQDMAKRVKKLIRKWKQEIDKIKLENTNGITKDPINRISSPLPSSDNNQAGVKRKINQYSHVNGKRQGPMQRTSSPRVSSPNIQRIHQSSPVRNKTKSPHPVGSPKLLPRNRIVLPRSSSSPNLTSNSNHPSPTLSPASSKLARNTISPLATENTDIKPEKCSSESSIDLLNAKKNGNQNGFHVNNVDSIKKEQFETNSKDCDTRIQEDRISSIDSGYQGTLSDEYSPTEISLDNKRFVPIDKPSTISPAPDFFESIEEEELAVEHKQFSEDPSSPSTTADGVNGTFDTNGTFCNWTDEINHDEFSVLPYIILD